MQVKEEHSAILLTFIKLPFVILSIFEWPLKTGLTVVLNCTTQQSLKLNNPKTIRVLRKPKIFISIPRTIEHSLGLLRKQYTELKILFFQGFPTLLHNKNLLFCCDNQKTDYSLQRKIYVVGVILGFASYIAS